MEYIDNVRNYDVTMDALKLIENLEVMYLQYNIQSAKSKQTLQNMKEIVSKCMKNKKCINRSSNYQVN